MIEKWIESNRLRNTSWSDSDHNYCNQRWSLTLNIYSKIHDLKFIYLLNGENAHMYYQWNKEILQMMALMALNSLQIADVFLQPVSKRLCNRQHVTSKNRISKNVK